MYCCVLKQMLTDFSEVHSASIALMMEVGRTSETSVNICLTIRQYIPEDSKLHSDNNSVLEQCNLTISSMTVLC
jgi:hypothetical protein